MSGRRRLVALAVLAIGVLAVGAPAAHADVTQCVGEFTGVADDIVVPSGAECHLVGAQVLGGVVAESDSALFTEAGTGVGGDVVTNRRVESEIKDSTIGGDVTCGHCLFQDVRASTVGGNVEIFGLADGSIVDESSIGRDLRIAESSAGGVAFIVRLNAIDGTVRFERNAGPTNISRNTVGGNYQILNNDLAGEFCPHDFPPGKCPLFTNGNFAVNQVGGSMQLIGNRGGAQVFENTIGATLQCVNNSAPFSSTDNTAARLKGQCQD